MNVLVTGAAGFIGFHVCKRLLAQGHAVTGVDSFNDYYAVELKRAREAELRRQPGYDAQGFDLCHSERLGLVFDRCAPKVVVHLAAQAGVRYSLKNPQAYIASNVRAFVTLLEILRHSPSTRLLYASSSSVYAGSQLVPYVETQRCDQPVSLYAATKRAGELMAHSYHHLFALQCIGLRFFTVYGPWGRPDMAPWIFVEKIERGQPIEVFNHGKLRRDFTYIDDVAGAVAALVEEAELPGYAIYNVGNNQPVELLDFIRCVERALGKKADMHMRPMQPGDVHETCADIRALGDVIGFAPKTSVEQGMRRFVDWYQAHPELAEAVARSRAS